MLWVVFSDYYDMVLGIFRIYLNFPRGQFVNDVNDSTRNDGFLNVRLLIGIFSCFPEVFLLKFWRESLPLDSINDVNREGELTDFPSTSK